MRVIFLLVITFFQYQVSAQSILEVNALDAQRNCWYHYFEESETFQIADFAGFSPQAHRIHKSDLVEMINDAITSVGQNKQYQIDLKGNYEVHLHCGAHGHALLVNAHESVPAISFLTKLDDLEKGSINLNLAQDKTGFQLGVSPHGLVIKHKPTISAPHFKTLLNSFFPDTFAAIRFIPNTRLGRLRLTVANYFKVQEVMDSINNHPVLKNYTEYIELNAIQSFVGEHALMFSGQF